MTAVRVRAVAFVLAGILCAVGAPGTASAKAGRHWWLILGHGDHVRAAAARCAVRARTSPLPHRLDGAPAGTLALGPYGDRGRVRALKRSLTVCLPKARIAFTAR